MKSNSLLLKNRAIGLISATLSSLVLSTSAIAGPAADSFQHNAAPHLPHSAKIDTSDKPMVGAGAGAMFCARTPVVAWFEKLDEMVAINLPTKDEEFILNQNLNQELERVQALTKVYKDISARYRILAKDIKAMPVQANWPDVQKYRDHRADFFNDEADCFTAMITPRKPAETIEDLRAELDDVNQKASSLKLEGQTLVSMDRALRQTYEVHAPRYSDALFKYVHHKQGTLSK